MSDMNYTNAIKRKLDELEVNYSFRDMDSKVVFTIPHQSKVVPVLNLMCILEDGDHVKLVCVLARDTAPEKRAELLKVINKLTISYRYIRYALDKDNDIIADYDFRLYGDEEASALHFFSRMLLAFDILEEAVKKIMPVLWKDDDDDD